MKSFKSISVLLFLFFTFSSCEDNMEVNKSENCKLTKYGQIHYLGSPPEGALEYLNELTYKNGRLALRIRHTVSYPSFIEKDSIIYDNRGRVNRIYQLPMNEQYFEYDEFMYVGSSKLPNKRQNVRKNGGNEIYENEDIWYNINRQIEKTIKISKNSIDIEVYKNESNYFYDNQNNLSKVEIKYFYLGNLINTSLFLFKNYDDKKNPFKGIPFIDMRHVSYSSNNFLINESGYLDENNELVLNQRSGRDMYEYNESGYPLIGEYDCN